MTGPDEPAFPLYALVGAAAAAERRARAGMSAGARAASVAAWPAEQLWRSPLGAPLRRRADEASAALEDNGRELVRRGRLRMRSTFDRTVIAVISHPATEALVASALDDPGIDRLIARLIDSRLIDELTARLLESKELALVLDYVTRSPELRAALADPTAGLAEDVTVEVLAGTVVADAAARTVMADAAAPTVVADAAARTVMADAAAPTVVADAAAERFARRLIGRRHRPVTE